MSETLDHPKEGLEIQERGEAPVLFADGWNPERFEYQHWISRNIRTLSGTSYGVSPETPKPNPALYDDVLVNRIYKIDIATFLTAERLSYLGISKLVEHAPDEASQIFLATQAADESRHYEVFCKRLADLGVTPEQRNELIDSVTTNEMRKFYDLVREQVDKGDFAGAMMAHNIILEGMAYPIYKYEEAYWSVFDPQLSEIIRGAFADEVHHVGFGEAIMQRYTKMGDDTRNTMHKLATDFHRLMTDVFEASIEHYIHMYQFVADQYMDILGDIQIFKGKLMRDVSEEDQVRILLEQIQVEHKKRMQRINLSV